MHLYRESKKHVSNEEEEEELATKTTVTREDSGRNNEEKDGWKTMKRKILQSTLSNPTTMKKREKNVLIIRHRK